MALEGVITELIFGGGAVSLSAVVGYFLRQQNAKIESVDQKLMTMRSDLKKDIKINKEEVINTFQNVCHERQDACKALQETKLEGMRKEGEALCRKIEVVKLEKDARWTKQEGINDQFKAHINKSEK